MTNIFAGVAMIFLVFLMITGLAIGCAVDDEEGDM